VGGFSIVLRYFPIIIFLMTQYLKNPLENYLFFKKSFFYPFLYKDAATLMGEEFLYPLG
jgi:hypothetical protein